MSDSLIETCRGRRWLVPERYHDQVCFVGTTCPLCQAMDALRRTNDDVIELRKQIIELERKREVLGT